MKPLLDVLQNKKPTRRPIWVMRQAGRYLPEYRAVRAKAGSFLNLCYNPELACEVTLQPLRRFDFDAAILFSDILVVPHAMGLSLDFREGEGPVLETVSSMPDVSKLAGCLSSWQFEKVWETVFQVKRALNPTTSLIGFCGAPWTVASYMIEGGSSDRKTALSVAIHNPYWFSALIEKIVEASIIYLNGQIAAGAEAVQIFDSWAGELPKSELDRLVALPIKKIIDGVRRIYPNFPVIAFARGVKTEHGIIARATGASAVGIEENCLIKDVLLDLDVQVAVQGNLSPNMLLTSDEELQQSVKVVLDGVPMHRHIFNLGHGVVPQTNPLAIEKMVRAVRRFDESFI